MMKSTSVLFCVTLFSLSCVSPGAEELRAGAAATNITPPLGIPIIGNFGKQLAANVHDELHVRALVVDDGKKKVALVVCDLLGMRGTVSAEARKRIKEATGIPEEHVLVSATHTHSAGDALGHRYDLKAPLTDYQKFVASRIADAVAIADRRLRPAEVASGKVDIPEHVFNRRWSMKEGTMPPNPFGKIDKAKMNPSVASPNLVDPVGPVDPTLSFVAFREPGGRLISLFAAYSVHYIGGVKFGDISADYFGVFCGELRKLQPEPPDAAAPPFVAMLANGTSGDINNVNFRHGGPKFPAYEKMLMVGRDVAGKVDGALKTVEWKKQAEVDARHRVVELLRKPVDAELAAWAEETAKKEVPEGKVDMPKIYAERVLSIVKAEQKMEVPLHFIRIGETGIGAMPVEVFAETGLEFRKTAPLPHSFLISMAHDYLGYLPTPRQLELGGYETWPGTNHLEPKSSTVMLQTLLEMADQAKP
ncbi:MAG: neutral/alkaline non-lysosomal ceramidase N-terminal domain-containing protein [Akkermansiaceae bacterium]|nr:neutral/alkaline non-lysosomal ceramidase N-terminal domain-containing protein [Akkermansiaceae bacterium]